MSARGEQDDGAAERLAAYVRHREIGYVHPYSVELITEDLPKPRPTFVDLLACVLAELSRLREEAETAQYDRDCEFTRANAVEARVEALLVENERLRGVVGDEAYVTRVDAPASLQLQGAREAINNIANDPRATQDRHDAAHRDGWASAMEAVAEEIERRSTRAFRTEIEAQLNSAADVPTLLAEIRRLQKENGLLRDAQHHNAGSCSYCSPGLPEFTCPACGAVTRARLADAPDGAP